MREQVAIAPPTKGEVVLATIGVVLTSVLTLICFCIRCFCWSSCHAWRGSYGSSAASAGPTGAIAVTSCSSVLEKS